MKGSTVFAVCALAIVFCFALSAQAQAPEERSAVFGVVSICGPGLPTVTCPSGQTEITAVLASASTSDPLVLGFRVDLKLRLFDGSTVERAFCFPREQDENSGAWSPRSGEHIAEIVKSKVTPLKARE